MVFPDSQCELRYTFRHNVSHYVKRFQRYPGIEANYFGSNLLAFFRNKTNALQIKRKLPLWSDHGMLSYTH